MSWGGGYVTEVPYTYGYYQHLSPQSIELCLTYQGIRSVPWRQGFTYCELACGHGVTAAILAALHPEGKFYVMDFNPSHIHYLAELTKAAKLTNLHYLDASFAQYVERDDLPEFDYISAHGIYSWASAENRQHIRRIIDKKLKIGGIVSISYNALPGWAQIAPIQYFMNYYRHQEATGDLFAKLQKAIEYLNQIQTNRGMFMNSDVIKARYESIKKQNPFYLIHEYFNSDWHPLYSSQVMEEMAEVKLQYVGSANLIENIPQLNLSQEAYNHINSLSNVKMKELAKDFYLNTQFRRDLYVKGIIPLSLAEKQTWLNETRFTLTKNQENFQWKCHQGMLHVHLPPEKYEPILEAIATQNGTAKDIFNHIKAKDPELEFPSFWERIFNLVSLNYIYPKTVKPRNLSSCRNFNEAVLKRVCFGKEITYLAAPFLYTALFVNYLQLLFISWEHNGKQKPLHEYVIEVMRSNNLSLANDEGKRLDKPSEQIELLEHKYQEFSKTNKTLLEKAGVLEFLNTKQPK